MITIPEPTLPTHTPQQDLEQRLNAAKTTAESIDAEGVVASLSPTTYKRAIDTLSSTISECVGGRGLLSETAAVTLAARKLEVRMQRNLQVVVDGMKKELGDAISKAEQNGEAGPLSACVTWLSAHGEWFRQSCSELFETAEVLLQRLLVSPVRVL